MIFPARAYRSISASSSWSRLAPRCRGHTRSIWDTGTPYQPHVDTMPAHEAIRIMMLFGPSRPPSATHLPTCRCQARGCQARSGDMAAAIGSRQAGGCSQLVAPRPPTRHWHTNAGVTTARVYATDFGGIRQQNVKPTRGHRKGQPGNASPAQQT